MAYIKKTHDPDRGNHLSYTSTFYHINKFICEKILKHTHLKKFFKHTIHFQSFRHKLTKSNLAKSQNHFIHNDRKKGAVLITLTFTLTDAFLVVQLNQETLMCKKIFVPFIIYLY
jgi:hypothetical protein